MSTPEHLFHPNDMTAPPAVPGDTVTVHTGRTRTETGTEWVIWHAAELAGVGLPLILAGTANGWFALIGAAVAAGWVTHEVMAHRARRPVLPEIRSTTPGTRDTSKEDRS